MGWLRRRTWMVANTAINPVIKLIISRTASSPRNRIDVQRLTKTAP
jgi:hypothetical protein